MRKLPATAILFTGLALAVPYVLAGDPPLPSGLGGGQPVQSGVEAGARGVGVSGFWEARAGMRVQMDRNQKQESILETRAQLRLERLLEAAALKLTTDLVYDDVVNDDGLELESGVGWLDLREASALFRPVDSMDLKLGRQTLTWGTGDLVFINDMFPKDWQSFFIGRDVEYLKAPSDAVKASVFFDRLNLDLVYTPRFDADRFIDGSRISWYSAALGRRTGRGMPLAVRQPDDWFDDDEIAARLYTNISGYELAAYAYHGFWKSPAGSDAVTGAAIFPELGVYGGSVRGTAGRGIGHLELGYYDSRNDTGGSNPLVRNGEFRALAGYEQEIARETTLGVQYYLERMLDYSDYRRTLPAGLNAADHNRHVLTARLTRFAMQQDLMLSLFAYYSPSDDDGYLRPKVKYRFDDHWTVEGGGNLFFGEDAHTFFGQFEKNSNVYMGVRYGFGG